MLSIKAGEATKMQIFLDRRNVVSDAIKAETRPLPFLNVIPEKLSFVLLFVEPSEFQANTFSVGIVATRHVFPAQRLDI